MITTFLRPESSRGLYFKLNNALHIHDPLISKTYKIAGLYSIHKDNKCYYVGQSQNLPSRISDHLFGRYENADEVRVYFVCNDGYSDFYERNKESRKLILENNELKLMQLLNPIDNLIIDHDKKFKPNELFLPLYEGWRNPESARILIEDLNLYTVCTFDHEEMFDIDKRLWMLHREFCELFAKKEDVKNA